ncbi:deoxynucleoside kinase [Candidatus Gracilibacteria bacterium]|nr:deoxynucleoside kinase [Candidatus Gracilibacteria bacterium]
MNKSDSYRDFISEPELNMTLKEFLKHYKRFPVIAITGPAGVGKSTFTRILADFLGGIIYTELPDENPFLSIIKNTKGKVSDLTLWLNNQNYFLATDVAQVTKGFIESKFFPIIFDFALTQPFIFSDINLSGDKRKAFNSIFTEQFKTLPKPDIIVEIKATNDVLVKRLIQRGKYIDDFVIKMTERINSYYNGGIVQDYFRGSTIKRIENNADLNVAQISGLIKGLIEEISV